MKINIYTTGKNLGFCQFWTWFKPVFAMSWQKPVLDSPKPNPDGNDEQRKLDKEGEWGCLHSTLSSLLLGLITS